MTSISHIKQLIAQGEGVSIEFKEAQQGMPKSLFETVCAFLNREGGSVFLGVGDKGEILGVPEEQIGKIIKTITTSSNDGIQLSPTALIAPKLIEINGKKIIHLLVSQSSLVHQNKGVVYDRADDGDFKIKDPTQIAELVREKQNYYSENTIYPALELADFEPAIFEKCRHLFQLRNKNHLWLNLGDEQLLNRAGLYKKDPITGKDGYTLAAVLLFGKEQTIQSCVPHYKIDALLRRNDQERYDDRLLSYNNLITAYDELMEFVERHLPDPFYLEGTQRVSLRNYIFREIVANFLVHREYTRAENATFIIYRDRIEVKNPNRQHGEGALGLDNFSTFPKNPAILKFFIQLGHAEELGSGIQKVTKWLPSYGVNSDPKFIEGSLFTTIIPLPEAEEESNQSSEKVVYDGVYDTPKMVYDGKKVVYDGEEIKLTPTIRKVLIFSLDNGNWTSNELRERLGYPSMPRNLKDAINTLIDYKILSRTAPDRSKLQSHIVTPKGLEIAELIATETEKENLSL
jgi:ATP-dependent DNA helicase RecG